MIQSHNVILHAAGMEQFCQIPFLSLLLVHTIPATVDSEECRFYDKCICMYIFVLNVCDVECVLYLLLLYR